MDVKLTKIDIIRPYTVGSVLRKIIEWMMVAMSLSTFFETFTLLQHLVNTIVLIVLRLSFHQHEDFRFRRRPRHQR